MTDKEEAFQLLVSKKISVARLRDLIALEEKINANDISPAKLDHMIDLDKKINEACDNYSGSFQVLVSALGTLIGGQVYGWHVIRVAISPNSYIKYQRILGIKLARFCPERGRLAHRSWGLKLADGVSNFWDAINGKIPGKRSDKILER